MPSDECSNCKKLRARVNGLELKLKIRTEERDKAEGKARRREEELRKLQAPKGDILDRVIQHLDKHQKK